MKVTCAQADLAAKLSLLSRAVPSNPTHPVLGNVLLVAESDRLGLAVFDLSLGMQIWIPAQAEETGTITLPARFLNDIVSRLPNADVEIVAVETSVTLSCGSGNYQMQGLGAEEFPELPQLEESEPLRIPAGILLEGLQGSLFAASSDESKQVLTGLHLSTKADSLEFAATDGHRLAIANTWSETMAVEAVAEVLAVTVPAKALRELERMLGKAETELSIQFDKTQVVFEFTTEQGSAKLTSRLLEGQYPAYQQLIPRKFERQATIERQLLISGLERIGVLAAQKNNVVKLVLDSASQQVHLSAEAPQLGSGQESLAAQISGDDLEIAFNVKYMIDGLKSMSGSEVQLQLNSATSPAVLSPLAGTKLTYLIMPIQIRN
jgi:DNA polymerase III subunit beta